MFEIFRNAVVVGVDSTNPTNNPSIVVQKSDGTTVSIWIYKRIDERLYQYTNGQWSTVESLPDGLNTVLSVTSPTLEKKRVAGVIGISNSSGPIAINDTYQTKYEIYVGMTGANQQGPATPVALMAAIKHIDSIWLSEAIYGMYIFPGIYSVTATVGSQQVSQTIIPWGLGYSGTILTINTYILQILGILSTLIYALDLIRTYRSNDIRNALILLIYALLGYALTSSLAIGMAAMLPINLEYYDASTIAAASGLIGEILGLVGYSVLTFQSDLAYTTSQAMSQFTLGAELTASGATIAQAGVLEIAQSLSITSFSPSGVGQGGAAIVDGIYYAMSSLVFYGLSAGTMTVGVMIMLLQMLLGWGLVLLGMYIANSTFRTKVTETVNYATETAATAALLA
ncbi:MAG: hypothetical protein [aquatic viral metagenome]